MRAQTIRTARVTPSRSRIAHASPASSSHGRRMISKTATGRTALHATLVHSVQGASLRCHAPATPSVLWGPALPMRACVGLAISAKAAARASSVKRGISVLVGETQWHARSTQSVTLVPQRSVSAHASRGMRAKRGHARFVRRALSVLEATRCCIAQPSPRQTRGPSGAGVPRDSAAAIPSCAWPAPRMNIALAAGRRRHAPRILKVEVAPRPRTSARATRGSQAQGARTVGHAPSTLIAQLSAGMCGTVQQTACPLWGPRLRSNARAKTGTTTAVGTRTRSRALTASCVQQGG